MSDEEIQNITHH